MTNTISNNNSGSFLNYFWKPVSNATHHYVAHQKVELQNIAKETLMRNATCYPDPLITQLKEALQQNLLDVKNKELVLELIEKFIENSEVILHETRDPKGYSIQLNIELFERIKRNLQTFGLQSDDVKAAIRFLEIVEYYQSGWIYKILQLDVKGILHKIGINLDEPLPDNLINKQAEGANQELDRWTISPIQTINPPKDLHQDLGTKLDDIQDLVIKKILTHLILPANKDSFQKIYKEAGDRAAKSGTWGEHFFNVLNEHFLITMPAPSLSQNLRYKLHMNVTLPILKIFMTRITKQVEVDVKSFLLQSPEKRIDSAFKVIFNPLATYMSAYISHISYLANASHCIPTTIDTMNEKYFNELTNDEGFDIKGMIQSFVQTLVERYTLRISWTKGLEISLDHFHTKLSQNYPLAKLRLIDVCFTCVKTVIVWTCFLTTGVFEKMIDWGCKQILTKQCIKLIHQYLLKSPSGAEGTHYIIQHLINAFLLDKVRRHNARIGPQTHEPTKLRSLHMYVDNLNGVLTQVFNAIYLSSATNDPQTMQHYASESSISSCFKAANLWMTQWVSPSIAVELLKRIEHVLYDEKAQGSELGILSELVWHIANLLAKSLTMNDEEISSVTMAKTEKALLDQLDKALSSGVEEAVHTILDPSKKTQDEVNATLSELKNQSEALQRLSLSLKLETWNDFDTNWKNLVGKVSEVSTQFQKTNIAIIQDKGVKLTLEFTNQAKNLKSSIDELNQLDAKYKKSQEELKNINALIKQIADATTHVDRKDKLLFLYNKNVLDQSFKLKIKDYISYLEKNITTYKTPEVISLDNKKKKEFDEESNKAYKTLQETAIQIAQLEQSYTNIQKLIISLNEHIQSIKPLAISKKDVEQALVKGIALGYKLTPAKGLIVMIVRHRLYELLKLRHKPYHWNSIIARICYAYAQLQCKS